MNYSNWNNGMPTTATAAEIIESLKRVSREMGPPPPPVPTVREVPRSLIDLGGQMMAARMPEVRLPGAFGLPGVLVAPAKTLVIVNPPLVAEGPP